MRFFAFSRLLSLPLAGALGMRFTYQHGYPIVGVGLGVLGAGFVIQAYNIYKMANNLEAEYASGKNVPDDSESAFKKRLVKVAFKDNYPTLTELVQNFFSSLVNG